MATTTTVEIKSKKEIVGTIEYEAPETLEEALQMDGEEKIFSLYAQQRKIRAMDNARREKTGGGLPTKITKALKGASKEQLMAILDQLGVDTEEEEPEEA